jgi:hypothetical protein
MDSGQGHQAKTLPWRGTYGCEGLDYADGSTITMMALSSVDRENDTSYPVGFSFLSPICE